MRDNWKGNIGLWRTRAAPSLLIPRNCSTWWSSSSEPQNGQQSYRFPLPRNLDTRPVWLREETGILDLSGRGDSTVEHPPRTFPFDYLGQPLESQSNFPILEDGIFEFDLPEELWEEPIQVLQEFQQVKRQKACNWDLNGKPPEKFLKPIINAQGEGKLGRERADKNICPLVYSDQF